MGNVSSDDEPVHDIEAEPYGFRVLSVAAGSPASNCKLIAEGERLLDDEDVAVEGELLDRARDDAEKRKRSASAAGDSQAASGDDNAIHSLVMFFDTIVAAAGVRLESNPEEFVKTLAAHEGRPMRLHVWNSKAAQLRELETTPNRHDGSGLLGIITEHGSYFGSIQMTLHVTDVLPLSPAERGGLVAIDDYILRAAGAEFDSIADFRVFIDERAGETVTLLVHSAGRDSIREVELAIPGHDEVWIGPRGGENDGIGLVVEQGIEHLLPSMGTIGRNEAPDERLSKADRQRAASQMGVVATGIAHPSLVVQGDSDRETSAGSSAVTGQANGAAHTSSSSAQAPSSARTAASGVQAVLSESEIAQEEKTVGSQTAEEGHDELSDEAGGSDAEPKL